jgi:hypothetical protein
MKLLHLLRNELNFLECPAHRLLVAIVTSLSQVTYLLTHWINKIHVVKEMLILELKASTWYYSSDPSGPILSQFDPFKIPPLSHINVNTIPSGITALQHKFVHTVQGQVRTLINWINRHSYTDNVNAMFTKQYAIFSSHKHYNLLTSSVINKKTETNCQGHLR